MAEAYLADRAHTLPRLAELLGYGDPSAFTRWFTEQFHMPPSRWREAKLAAEREPLARGRAEG